MGNGQLVLSSGRPDNWIAIAADPSGTVYTRPQVTYANRYSHDDTKWWYGSSGYTSLEPVAANQVLQYVDNCAAHNSDVPNGCSVLDHFTDPTFKLLTRTPRPRPRARPSPATPLSADRPMWQGAVRSL